ncbi:hypothetical protein GCM10022233_56010 [Streptomyces shaanxiensis]|uniref:Uncharacterized protein n=1 Tax=Streptomyces shaanxiensis TaxID=653357 RepID=A0ABP7VPR9_9ACTN
MRCECAAASPCRAFAPPPARARSTEEPSPAGGWIRIISGPVLGSGRQNRQRMGTSSGQAGSDLLHPGALQRIIQGLRIPEYGHIRS